MDDFLRTANKGEWAELYVFFKIMLDRVLYAADEELTPRSDEWFKFIRLYRHSGAGKVQEFDLSKEGIVTVIGLGGSANEVVDNGKLSEKTRHIFRRIKEASSTFEVEDAATLMATYGINTVKAGAASKTDIDADVLVSNTTSAKRMGFSVKSYIGGAPTLVNSSSHTNFIYEVNGFTGDIEVVNDIGGRTKVRDRVEAIKKNGGSLKFRAMSSETLRKNLRLQDSIYPQVIAEMIQCFYSGMGNDFKTLGKLVSQKDQNDSSEAEIREMTKRYLRSSALGMVPGTEWSGLLSTQGGYIVVLETGDLVCYSLYFDDEFREYLYSNTRFDTPSTTKYNFGKLYIEDGKLLFNLNLQIRFKSV